MIHDLPPNAKRQARAAAEKRIVPFMKLLSWGFILCGGVVVGVAVRQAQTDQFPFSTSGQLVPTMDPDESHRVFHPNGLSIIRPRCWDSTTIAREDESATIELQSSFGAHRSYRSRIHASIARTDLGGGRSLNDVVDQNGRTWNVWQFTDVGQEGRSSVHFVLRTESGGRNIEVRCWPGTQSEGIPEMILRYIGTAQTEDYCNSGKQRE